MSADHIDVDMDVVLSPKHAQHQKRKRDPKDCLPGLITYLHVQLTRIQTIRELMNLPPRDDDGIEVLLRDFIRRNAQLPSVQQLPPLPELCRMLKQMSELPAAEVPTGSGQAAELIGTESNGVVGDKNPPVSADHQDGVLNGTVASPQRPPLKRPRLLLPTEPAPAPSANNLVIDLTAPSTGLSAPGPGPGALPNVGVALISAPPQPIRTFRRSAPSPAPVSSANAPIPFMEDSLTPPEFDNFNLSTLKPTHGRQRWTEEEDRALRRGIASKGEGKWKEIHDMFPTELKDRTPVNIKDRWRQLEKEGWTLSKINDEIRRERIRLGPISEKLLDTDFRLDRLSFRFFSFENKMISLNQYS